MNLTESVRIALRSLAANKMRSILTMLGIIIGVGAVIALMSIGRGVQAQILSSLSANGTNLLFIQPGASNQGGVSQGAGSAATLTLDDAIALKDAGLPAVADVAPEFGAQGQLTFQGQNARTRVTGVTPPYATVRNVSIASGEWFNDGQISGRSTVVVLGPTTAANLFGDGDPVDQTIKVNGIPFRVIGVTVAKGGSGFGSQDDVAFMPITTLNSRVEAGGRFRGATRVSQISIQVVDPASIQPAIQDISTILRERHRILTGDDDFRVTSLDDLLKTATQTTDILTAFLGGIAAISLVVGGIGIMNIMLVSVTERTREIGIRKAIGAKRRDILVQFLTEAVVMSITGGLIGIAIGWGLSRLFSNLSGGQLNAVVDLDAVLLATLFSAAIGLFFGVYPATRAAGLNPIDALRYE
ncbi:MAG: ABC transporter permease [Chloroflexi bacterium]|nr:ABC transporter permease [Chloroflexota bacterium]